MSCVKLKEGKTLEDNKWTKAPYSAGSCHH